MMARANVTTQQVTRAGLAPALTEPTADGDVVDTGDVALYVTNGGGVAHTVTVLATAAQDGLDVEDLVVSVAAGATVLIGPLPKRTFGQPAGAVASGGDDQGRAYVDYATPADWDRAVVTL
jgi:hypothetical protein